MGRLEGKINNPPITADIGTAFDAFALGAKARLDSDTMVQLVHSDTGRSFTNGEMMPLLLSSRFGFGATIPIMDKDVALGRKEARAQNKPMRTIVQAAQVWRFVASQGEAVKGLSELALLIEVWAGTGIRNRPKH